MYGVTQAGNVRYHSFLIQTVNVHIYTQTFIHSSAVIGMPGSEWKTQKNDSSLCSTVYTERTSV